MKTAEYVAGQVMGFSNKVGGLKFATALIESDRAAVRAEAVGPYLKLCDYVLAGHPDTHVLAMQLKLQAPQMREVAAKLGIDADEFAARPDQPMFKTEKPVKFSDEQVACIYDLLNGFPGVDLDGEMPLGRKYHERLIAETLTQIASDRGGDRG